MEILLELAADLARQEESQDFGGLGGFLEADHFFAEFDRGGVVLHHGGVVDDLGEDFLGPPDRAAGVGGSDGWEGDFDRTPREPEGFSKNGDFNKNSIPYG